MDVREFLRESWSASDARQRAQLGLTVDTVKTQWARQVEKLDAGEPVGVYWFTIREFLTRQQQALGGRWIVQEDGSLMKDLN